VQRPAEYNRFFCQHVISCA